MFCCLHLAGPKVYKVCFQEKQCLTPALLFVRVGLHVNITITPVCRSKVNLYSYL